MTVGVELNITVQLNNIMKHEKTLNIKEQIKLNFSRVK